MTSTGSASPWVASARRPFVPAAKAALTGRLAVAGAAVTGGALVITGAFRPWLSTFAGLIAYPGVTGANGRILAGAGAAVVAIALWYALRGGNHVRWALGGAGFALVTFNAYLLIQLRATIDSLANTMAFARAESGLYVAGAGALLVFATLFLPGEGTTRDDTAPDVAVRARFAGREGLRSKARWLAIPALVTAGAVHVPIMFEHLHEVPYLGALFVALTVTTLIGAAVLAVYDSRVVWLAMGAVCLAAVAGYLWSRGVGLPGASDDIGDWMDPLGIAAITSETIVAITAAFVLMRAGGASARRRRNSQPIARPTLTSSHAPGQG